MPPPTHPERVAGEGPLPIGDDLLRELAALCEADPAREACGFLARRAGRLEIVPIPNAADRYHAADPLRFPRTSRDSFLMDPRSQLRAQRALEASGGAVAAVWHSHVEAEACLSAKDRADAIVDGTPQVPGADYVVLGMRGGRVTGARRYRLTGEGFVEVALAGGDRTR